MKFVAPRPFADPDAAPVCLLVPNRTGSVDGEPHRSPHHHVHDADRDDGADLESARWAVIYALRLATFSAHLVKVMLQAFQAFFDGFLRGREVAFDGDQENQAAD